MTTSFAAAIERAEPPEPVQAAKAPGLVETAFYVFVTFYAAKALFLVIAIGPQNLQDNQLTDLDGSWLRLLWAVCYAVGLVYIAKNFESVYRSVKNELTLCLLLAWCLTTALWSAEPFDTVQHSIILSICALLGILMGTRFSTEGVVNILVFTFAVALVMSAVAIFLIPGWGKMGGIHAGAWSGIFIHKNGLGSAAVMGATVFGYRATQTRGQERMMWLALIVLSVILAIGARSATALVVLMAVAGGAWLTGLVRVRGLDFWLAFFALLTAGFFFFWMLTSNLELFFRALGKDMTLTGRMELWQWGFDSFLHKPIGGYGFESFWLDTSDHGGARIRVLAGWAAPHIHNSWLQIALDIGIVGVVLYILFLTRIIKTAWRLAAATNGAVYRTVLLLLLQILIYSGVETLLLKRNSETFILLVALSVTLWREARQSGDAAPVEPGRRRPRMR